MAFGIDVKAIDRGDNNGMIFIHFMRIACGLTYNLLNVSIPQHSKQQFYQGQPNKPSNNGAKIPHQQDFLLLWCRRGGRARI
jgi:hypothetical protein